MGEALCEEDEATKQADALLDGIQEIDDAEAAQTSATGDPSPAGDSSGAGDVLRVPAVASGEVHVVPMTEASAVAGIHLPDGYRTVAGIVSSASAGD